MPVNLNIKQKQAKIQFTFSNLNYFQSLECCRTSDFTKFFSSYSSLSLSSTLFERELQYTNLREKLLLFTFQIIPSKTNAKPSSSFLTKNLLYKAFTICFFVHKLYSYTKIFKLSTTSNTNHIRNDKPPKYARYKSNF